MREKCFQPGKKSGRSETHKDLHCDQMALQPAIQKEKHEKETQIIHSKSITSNCKKNSTATEWKKSYFLNTQRKETAKEKSPRSEEAFFFFWEIIADYLI